jgi:hypothetical protein
MEIHVNPSGFSTVHRETVIILSGTVVTRPYKAFLNIRGLKFTNKIANLSKLTLYSLLRLYVTLCSQHSEQ